MSDSVEVGTLPEQPKRPKTHFLRRVVQILSVLVAVVALGFALYVGNELRQDWQDTKNYHNDMQEQVDALKANLQNFENILGQQKAELNATNTGLQRLSDLTSGSTDHWVMSEAEYLAQLANLNLQFEGNAVSAIALLQAADQRVATLTNPSILSVRQTLAKDIAALQTVPVVDTAGVLAKINALMEQVEKLPLVPQLSASQVVLKSPGKPTKLDTYLSNWKEALATSWHSLKEVIIIRRHNEPIEPLLAPEQYLFLQQNLQVQLQQAQWALLHRNQAIYLDSLKKAQGWVNHFFTDNGMVTLAVQQNLTDLQKINIQPSLPDISDAIVVIQQAAKKINNPTLSAEIKKPPVTNTTSGGKA